MRSSRLIGAAIVVCVLTKASAASGQWIKFTSANFELFTTAGEKKGREAILYFEQVRDFFLRALNIKDIPNTQPVRIVAFASEKEYLPYNINEYAAAYYVTDGRHDFIVMRGIAADSYHVSVHEFTHLIIRYTKLKLPVWLNEGLAEVYSTLKPAGKKVQVGDLIPGRLLELRRSKWIDLNTLTTAGHDSPYYNEKTRAGAFYAESWALTHMIVLSSEYAACKTKLVPALMDGRPAAEVFADACGKSMVAVQKDLMQYVNGSRFFAGLFDIQLAKRAEAPEVTEVEPLESGIALADLLMLTRRRAEAHTRLDALAKEYPKSWQPEAALAELAWHEGQLDRARTHFARAAELGSTDAQMYMDYAAVDHGKSSLLRKALELKPDSQEAQFRLGLALIGDGAYAEAVDRLRAITRVTPEQAFSYFYGLAYASYRLGQKPEAEKFAAQARKWAKQPEENERVDDLAGFINPKPPPPVRQPKVDTIEGTLRQVDCLGATARLELETEGKTVRLAIPDPNRIRVRNSKTGPAEFACGPQKSQPVLVEYYAKPDARLGTSGEVRAIEFR